MKNTTTATKKERERETRRETKQRKANRRIKRKNRMELRSQKEKKEKEKQTVTRRHSETNVKATQVMYDSATEKQQRMHTTHLVHVYIHPMCKLYRLKYVASEKLK